MSLRLGVLISGSGSNLQAIIDAINEKKIEAKINIVISSNDQAFGIVRAKKNNIPVTVINKKTTNDVSGEILKCLSSHNVDLIVLAGYLGIISPTIINKYQNKIINIHPSLLPKHGGKGMYGIHVHEDVLKDKETISGATVHYVTDKIDGGKIILQKTVPVESNDTPKTLAERVLTVEHNVLVEAIKLIINQQK